jgi:peptide/nickel transport system ATP-binding protein
MSTRVLTVENLAVSFRGIAAVRDVSFTLDAGECLAIVGESGSGKSVTARALLGLTGGEVAATRLELGSRSLLDASARDWRRIRGGDIGLVLQDALVSLDPLRPIGREIADSLRLHTTMTPAERRDRVLEALTEVGMPDPEIRMLQRAGELSGGLRQRALIASAIAAKPSVIIADEPTTALDVTVQSQVLRLLDGLRRSGTALLLISHDLAVVREIADRVAVMRDGELVEYGETAAVLGRPQHDYTRQLIRSVPTGVPRGESLSLREREPAAPNAAAPNPDAPNPVVAAEAPPVLETRSVSKSFARPHAPALLAVDTVSLTLSPGTTLGLVGESGSGKTTVARMMLGLIEPDDGEVLLHGERFSGIRESARRPRRHLLGAVYQDPLSSFDPRHTVRRILHDAADAAASGSTTVAELLDAVELPTAVLGRRPLHLSGGQRQRVAIARALAARPSVIVCDEPVSALDVSVQAVVLDLLDDLQREFGLAYVFISHDLGVVRHMSDRVAVMHDGRIVEEGDPARIFAAPQHEYTQRLVDAIPRLQPTVE